MDLKKAYYYIICLTALFVLFWGIVDLSSSTIGLVANRDSTPQLDQPSPAPADSDTGPFLESYYQKKMLYDRLWDSLARIVVSGAVFAVCRLKVAKLEG